MSVHRDLPRVSAKDRFLLHCKMQSIAQKLFGASDVNTQFQFAPCDVCGCMYVSIRMSACVWANIWVYACLCCPFVCLTVPRRREIIHIYPSSVRVQCFGAYCRTRMLRFFCVNERQSCVWEEHNGACWVLPFRTSSIRVVQEGRGETARASCNLVTEWHGARESARE